MQIAQKNFYKKFLGRAGEVKAAEFLIKEKKTDELCRFDVIEIENGEINHILDAFSM